MKLFYLFFLPIVTSFNIKKLIGNTIIGSSLFFNNVNPINAYPQLPFANEHMQSTKISVEHNNIYFYGSITSDSCQTLKNKLNDLDFNSKLYKITYNLEPPPINLHIQSYGGSLMDTLYIADLIEMIETPVNTYVDGYAASAGSILSVVGKKRYMTKNSLILIHQLSSGNDGKFQELDDEMKNLQQLMNKIKQIYVKHTDIPYLQLTDLLKHDLWLDADTCKKLGLIDEIIQ